jgi:hypothetical protein
MVRGKGSLKDHPGVHSSKLDSRSCIARVTPNLKDTISNRAQILPTLLGSVVREINFS